MQGGRFHAQLTGVVLVLPENMPRVAVVVASHVRRANIPETPQQVAISAAPGNIREVVLGDARAAALVDTHPEGSHRARHAQEVQSLPEERPSAILVRMEGLRTQ